MPTSDREARCSPPAEQQDDRAQCLATDRLQHGESDLPRALPWRALTPEIQQDLDSRALGSSLPPAWPTTFPDLPRGPLPWRALTPEIQQDLDLRALGSSLPPAWPTTFPDLPQLWSSSAPEIQQQFGGLSPSAAFPGASRTLQTSPPSSRDGLFPSLATEHRATSATATPTHSHSEQVAVVNRRDESKLSPPISFDFSVAPSEAYRILHTALGNSRKISRALRHRARPLRTRKRVELKIKALEGGAEFLADLKKDAILWIQRLNGFYAQQAETAPPRLPPAPSLLRALPTLPDNQWSLEDLLNPANEGPTLPAAGDLFGLLTAVPDESLDQRATWFNTSLSAENVHAFNDFLRTSFAANAGASLTPQAVRRGLVHILSGIRTICGGRNLSKLSGTVHYKATRCIDALLDCQRSWNAACSISQNQTEINTILFRVVNDDIAAPGNLLSRYFDCLTAEWQYYSAVKDAGISVDLPLAKRLAALCVFALFLSRPASRAQLIFLIPFSSTRVQFEDRRKAVAPRKVYLTFASHKGASSFGAIFWPVSHWITPLLEFYLYSVRPVLLTELSLWGGEGTGDLLFPPATATGPLLIEFAKIAGLPDFTLSQVRTVFCDHVQGVALLPENEWCGRAKLIQNTASHGVSTVVIKHYDTGTKLYHEDLLESFVTSECLRPALKRAQDYFAVTTSSLPTTAHPPPSPTAASPANDPAGSSSSSSSSSSRDSESGPPADPVRKKRPRPPQPENEDLTVEGPCADSSLKCPPGTPRSCRNRLKGKRCLSGKVVPVFESESSENCIPCHAGYGGKGIFNSSRAKKLRASHDTC